MPDAPIDREALLDLVDEDPVFLKTLIETFLAECSTYMDNMRAAISEKNGPTLWKEAHGLKGALANLKAESAREAARRVEAAGRSGAFDEAEQAFEGLEENVERLRKELEGIARDLA